MDPISSALPDAIFVNCATFFSSLHAINPLIPVPLVSEGAASLNNRVVDLCTRQQRSIEVLPGGEVWKLPENSLDFYLRREEWILNENRRLFWSRLPGGKAAIEEEGVSGKDFGAWLDEHPDVCNITSLVCSRAGLTLLPPEIARFTKLEILNLSHNYLSELVLYPAWESLCVLNVSHNCLKQLPAVLTTFSHLSFLAASHNQLECIPSEMRSLESLEQLLLDHNLLTALPPLSDHLRILELRNNHFTTVPQTPQSLQELALSGNPLTPVYHLPETLQWRD